MSSDANTMTQLNFNLSTFNEHCKAIGEEHFGEIEDFPVVFQTIGLPFLASIAKGQFSPGITLTRSADKSLNVTRHLHNFRKVELSHESEQRFYATGVNSSNLIDKNRQKSYNLSSRFSPAFTKSHTALHACPSRLRPITSKGKY